MCRRLLPALLILLLLAACRNPDVREDAVVEAPDTAAVDGPLIDPEELDAADAPGLRQSADELEARRTILGDPTVQEAQVLLAGDSVLVSAVLLELGAGDAELKAEQFVIAAYRHMERPARTPDSGPLAPSRFTYLVTLRDVEGDVLFEGIKPAAVATLTEEPRRR